MLEPLNIVFAGTPDFSVPALDALLASRHRVIAVYTQPDRRAGRGRKLQASPVKLRALEHGLAVHQPASLRDPAEQQRLEELAPDVMVVVAYGLLLPPAVLAIPRLGCLNIHASLLPRWRGAAPIQRAILAGDRETGVTIMQMDRGLDTGDMLNVVRCRIEPDDTGVSLHDRLAGLGAGALTDTLDRLQQGTVEPVPQNPDQACYADKLNKAEALLDWRRPAVDLERQVRAFDPWPVAETGFDGQTLRVWAARVLESDGVAGDPGAVIATGRDGVDVACGRGVLRLLRLQLPGGRALSAAEFLNARSLAGVTFTPAA